MPLNDYHFITHWRVRGRAEDVAELLGNTEGLSRWWPSVYLGAKVLKPGDAHGVGQVAELHTKGWLPYTLRWRLTVLVPPSPVGFTIAADGDFVGRGIWTFRQEGEWVAVTYDWRIRADKPVLKWLSFLLKPLFRWNHRWAMRKGEESLALELQRRHAHSSEERQAVPPPPGPMHPVW